jgi:hypothetical protein
MNNFYSQFVKLFDETISEKLITEINKKYSIPTGELKQLFEEVLLIDDRNMLVVPLKKTIKGSTTKLEPKVKKTVNRKVPDDDKRCIALTKGNDRCKSSQSNKNGHSFLCSLHTKNGVDKYGVLEEYKEQYLAQQNNQQQVLNPIQEETEHHDEVDNKIEAILANNKNLKLEFVE